MFFTIEINQKVEMPGDIPGPLVGTIKQVSYDIRQCTYIDQKGAEAELEEVSRVERHACYALN